MTKIIKSKVKANNRHWKNFLDKNYLGSHNLEKGEELLVTIQKFEGEEKVKGSDGTDSLKPVLYFKENVPKMIMNITNGNTVSALYGTHPDNWIGKQIQIFSAPVKAFGKVQDALRIRDIVPKGKVDNTEALRKIGDAKNQEELKAVYTSLTIEEKNDGAVIELKEKLKKLYATS